MTPPDAVGDACSGAEARAAVLGDPDMLSLIVRTLEPAHSLRATECVSPLWRVAVRSERALRRNLPWTKWAYFGGREPERYDDHDTAGYLRVDTIGFYGTHLPPLPECLEQTSACVLRDGSIVVGGTRSGLKFEAASVAYKFVPQQWRWLRLHARGASTLPGLISYTTFVPFGPGFAAVGGFDTWFSPRLCIYTPTSRSPCTYDEEVRDLVHFGRTTICVEPCTLTRPGAFQSFLFAYLDGSDSRASAVKHPPLTFSDDDILSTLPLPIQALTIAEDVGVGGAFVTQDLAIVMQPRVCGLFAVLWACRPHGPWLKVAFVAWSGVGGFSCDTPSLPRLAVVELDPSKTGAKQPYLVLAQSFRAFQPRGRIGTRGWKDDVWLGAPLRKIENAMSLVHVQSPDMDCDEVSEVSEVPSSSGSNWTQQLRRLTNQGLVRLEDVTEYLKTPVRADAALIAIPTYY